MNLQDRWEKALKKTEIVRPRIKPLATFEATTVPYIFLANSEISRGDTVVRKGEVVVEKPAIVLPFNMPHFEGFDFEEELDVNEDLLMSFFLVRGVSFPSFRYNNKTASLDIYEGKLPRAVQHYSHTLGRDENTHTGLIIGPADCWQFSVMIFVGSQITRSAEGDIRRLFEDFGKTWMS